MIIDCTFSYTDDAIQISEQDNDAEAVKFNKLMQRLRGIPITTKQ